MIQHRLFPKGEYCHALISSPSNPNILFVVRGLILEVKMDDHNPQYMIKIVKFYDDINFLKRYFIGQRFQTNLIGKQTAFKFKRSNFNTCEDFENRLSEENSWYKYTIVADSIMCTKTEAEARELFNTVQTFMIEKAIKDIFEMSTRVYYRTGQYYFQTRDDYEMALKRFLKDRQPVSKHWIDDILNRATFDELDEID